MKSPSRAQFPAAFLYPAPRRHHCQGQILPWKVLVRLRVSEHHIPAPFCPRQMLTGSWGTWLLPCSSGLWFITEHHTITLCENPARESGPTCVIILRAFLVLLGECVSLSVIHLSSLKALCEFHGLIWLSKSSLAGRMLPVSSRTAVFWLAFHESLPSWSQFSEICLYPLPLLICWCFLPPRLFFKAWF